MEEDIWNMVSLRGCTMGLSKENLLKSLGEKGSHIILGFKNGFRKNYYC